MIFSTRLLPYNIPIKRLIILFAIAVSWISCQSTINQGQYRDKQINEEILSIKSVVDSVVINQHPDSLEFFESFGARLNSSALPGQFNRYAAESYFSYEHKKDFEKALEYADSTIQQLGSYEQYQLYYLNANLLKVDALRRQNLYGSSIQLLLDGWQEIDTTRTPCLASEYLGRLGSISYLQENYSESMNYYRRGIKSSIECYEPSNFKFYEGKYKFTQNMASNYTELQMPDSALYYSNQSIDIAKNELGKYIDQQRDSIFARVAYAVAIGNKAIVLENVGRGEEAVPLWEKSIEINRQSGFANEHAELMRLYLAEYYIVSNELREAKSLLDQTKEWLENHTSSTAEIRWLKIYWRWLEEVGDVRGAYTTYQKYSEMRNSNYNSKMELARADLATQIENLKNTFAIEQLQDEKEDQKLYLIFFTTSSLMGLLILFLVGKNWRESKKNVTRLTNLNNTISKKNTELERTNRIITKIMNIISHDLRSPLTGIREVSGVMKEDKDLAYKYRKWASIIQSTTIQSLDMMREILRLNPQKFVISENVDKSNGKPLDLAVALEKCVELQQLQANKKSQTIHLTTPKNVFVHVGKSDFVRVVNNLLENAIKFSPEGKCIHVELKKSNDLAVISIRDEGVGIPNHKKDQIFKMNSSAKRNGTNNEASYGMGLSISKEIIQANGGSLWFESSEAEGTTFFIELPAQKRNNQKGMKIYD